jgi:hypothetical protein
MVNAKEFRKWLPVMLVLALLLAGCATAPTPGVPEAPQVTVSRYVQLGAASSALAADTAIALYNSKQIDANTFNQIRTYLKLADQAFRDIATETASADTWAVMRTKIAAIGAKIAVSQTVTDPTLQAQLNAIVTALQNILGVV